VDVESRDHRTSIYIRQTSSVITGAATAFLLVGVGARSGVTAAMEQRSGAHALLRVRDGVSAAAAAGPAGFLGVAGILGTAALIIREL
jgi:hypothetical protein